MSWLVMLNDTYNNTFGRGANGPLPIAHTTQNADIEVIVDINGDYVSSRVIEGDKETRIPCSESSASRSGKNPVSHPLHDKLQYVAGDYSLFGGSKGSEFHKQYMISLGEWCNSNYSNKKVCAVYNYLKKGCLIQDLVNEGILICDENNKLIEKWTGSKDDKPQIFKTLAGAQNQSDAFVRFGVMGFDNIINLWDDPKVCQDYIDFYLSKQKEKQLCYVTGEIVPCSNNHPKRIRHAADQAKLISANDESGYTYRGRFKTSEEAVQISYEISQKAHNALKWLITKQGKNFGDKVFLLWGTKDQKMPIITGDTFDEAILYEDEDDIYEEPVYTKEEIARRFNMAISGYKASIDSHTDLALIGLDSATPGRLSITFYREFHGTQGNELFDNIKAWHEECSWIHTYKKHDNKQIEFIGAPALEEIAKSAYGTEQNKVIKADSKLVGATVERLLPCIVDKARIPNDIVHALVRKAICPQNYKESYNWHKVVSITCSIYKRHRLERSNYKEVWDVNVDNDSVDIVYNCGRLLAVADEIERYALWLQDEKRETNAIRFFTKFAVEPCKTWRIINDKLIPYIRRLGDKASLYYKIKEEISSKIPPDKFAELKNLDGRMVLGFDAQKNEFKKLRSGGVKK
ncbi:MAG: type I-C CRISPR-associated protein Cas8c/Csd1 [Hungateiclostridium thermocellum]|nr:type I-C CRISPR-associated protein Cas8c/Csd1 [Acetivibrio thermocellus]